MNYVKIAKWANEIDIQLFEEMKTVLLEKYIDFAIIDNDKATKEMVCEKLCDYIEKTMLRNKLSFDELVNYYCDSLGKLVSGYLDKECKGNDAKGKPVYVDSRAMKYFNLADLKRKDKEHPLEGLEDFSRIIFCLYSEVIKNKRQNITNFDYSFDNVKCQILVNSLEAEEVKEKVMLVIDQVGKRFNMSDKYSKDSFIAVMSIIMFYHLKNKKSEGEQ